MKRLFILVLAVCVLFGGCASLMDGSYVSVTPHQVQNNQTESGSIHVSDYDGLCNALANMAQNGVESAVIYVSQYDQTMIETDMRRAEIATVQDNPIAAYAVEEITWELGTNSGQSAVAVNISYIHDRKEIQKIREVSDIEQAKQVIGEELDNCATGVVLYLQNYRWTDFAQLVEDYAFSKPQSVMETPQVTANVYPERGSSRVVELKFTYQTSRDVLRSMQAQVRPIFASAVLYVSGDAQEREKFSQLYSFLMKRYNYKVETSITPAYSLLHHGVGDAKAFATVYASMCREAGLSCDVISGTRLGDPWYWNQINDNGAYYHVDLLRSNELGIFQELTDGEMEGYVWDYSAYPASPEEPLPGPEETQPETIQTEDQAQPE